MFNSGNNVHLLSRLFAGFPVGGSSRTLPPRSLSWHLGFAALSVALPLIVVTLILVGWVARSDREAKRTLLVGDAHALADAVAGQIATYFVLSRSLASSSLLLHGDLAAFQQQAADILREMPGVTLVVYSRDGRPLLSYPQAPVDSPLWRSQAELVRRALASKATFLSDVSPSSPNETTHASIETPVLQDGEPIFEIEFILEMDTFAELVEHQNFPSGWLAGIIDRNGNFVVRRPTGPGLAGTPASPEFRAAAEHPPGSVATHYSIDGQQIVSAYAVMTNGWTVGVAADASQFEVGPNVLLLTVALAAGALTLSLVLSLHNGRRLTRLFQELQTKAEQLVAGTAIPAGSSGVLELDALCGALVEASKVLRRRADRQNSAEDELRNSEKHFRLLADSVPQLVWTARPDGRIDYANARREHYGVGGVSRTDWETIIHPDDRRATAETWLRASESGDPYEKEHRLMVAGNGYRWHLSRAAPLLDEQGAIVRWYGTTTDINDHKLREEKIRSLIREVNHRSRNLLAVAQSIARQSVKDGDSAREFERKFSQRVLALVTSQNLLTDHQWGGVGLDALLCSQTRNPQALATKRLISAGPPISLNPSAAQILGLAIHELYINAVNHGALANAEGQVAVAWRIEDGEGEPKFEMEWREQGGPPVNPKPKLGFGSVLIARMVAQGLNANANLIFEADGVIWRLIAPMREIVVAA